MKYIIIIFHIVCNGSYNLVSIEVLSACTHFNQARVGKTSGDENKEGEKKGGGERKRKIEGRERDRKKGAKEKDRRESERKIE